MTAAEETPEFEQAVDRLRRFLADQGWPTTIAWRTETDIVRLPSGDVVVHRRSPSASASRAREHYEEGRRRGVGVALDVSCELGDSACASIFWTTDAREAECRLMPARGLKLVIATPRRRAVSAGLLTWWFAARRARRWERDLAAASKVGAA